MVFLSGFAGKEIVDIVAVLCAVFVKLLGKLLKVEIN